MRIVSLIFCFLTLSTAVAFADTPVDFSGQWVASDKPSNDDNKSDSDSAPHPSGSHGGGGRGGHGMGGGGHHHSADNPNGSSTANAQNSPADPRLHGQSLIIRQSDTVFDVTASGQRMVYRFDNRNNYGAPYGGTVTLTWQPPEMVIETHPDGGGTVAEYYTLSDDGKKLNLRIVTQSAGSDNEREIRRTFVRDDGSSATSTQTLP
ncbi:MAG TPA: hypothetical protein VHW73_09015 [Rudaea sp.]|jgi:hypothetical protein|nr:hypothetical protein [Rudaea sp.]